MNEKIKEIVEDLIYDICPDSVYEYVIRNEAYMGGVIMAVDKLEKLVDEVVLQRENQEDVYKRRKDKWLSLL